MNHPGDLISAYLDGELDPATRAQVGEHLESCAACSVELTAVSAARSALHDLPMLEPPPGLLLAPQPARGWARGAWAWATAGAAALALAAALVIGPGAAGDPVDLDTLAERHTARVVVEPGISTVRAVIGGP
jgi:anti-sigma factor RsiW